MVWGAGVRFPETSSKVGYIFEPLIPRDGGTSSKLLDFCSFDRRIA